MHRNCFVETKTNFCVFCCLRWILSFFDICSNKTFFYFTFQLDLFVVDDDRTNDISFIFISWILAKNLLLLIMRFLMILATNSTAFEITICYCNTISDTNQMIVQQMCGFLMNFIYRFVQNERSKRTRWKSVTETHFTFLLWWWLLLGVEMSV